MTQVRKTRFVQIGEKVNGRIRKNEQYSVDKFARQVLPNANMVIPKVKVPNWFSRTFKRSSLVVAMNNAEDAGYRKGYNQAFEDLKKNVGTVIDNDEFGKK